MTARKSKPIVCWVRAEDEYHAQCAAFDPGFVDERREEAPVFPIGDTDLVTHLYRVEITATRVRGRKANT